MENEILEILKQIQKEQIKRNEQLEEGQKRIEKKLDSVYDQTADLTKLESEEKVEGGVKVTDYRNEMLRQAYERGYKRGVKLARLEIITVLLKESKYDKDFIKKVAKASADEIELVEIAIRMFESGEDIYYVAKYTKFEIEQVERIKDCTISEKKA